MWVLGWPGAWGFRPPFLPLPDLSCHYPVHILGNPQEILLLYKYWWIKHLKAMPVNQLNQSSQFEIRMRNAEKYSCDYECHYSSLCLLKSELLWLQAVWAQSSLSVDLWLVPQRTALIWWQMVFIELAEVCGFPRSQELWRSLRKEYILLIVKSWGNLIRDSGLMTKMEAGGALPRPSLHQCPSLPALSIGC